MGKAKFYLKTLRIHFKNSEHSSQTQEGALENVGVWLFSVIFGVLPVKITLFPLLCP